MKRTAGSIAIITAIILIIASLAACSGNEDRIVGTWKHQETGLLGIVTETSYTFSEDGSGSVTALGVPAAFTYTLEKDELCLTFTVLGVSTTSEYTVSISGDTLKMTDKNGTSTDYTRA